MDVKACDGSKGNDADNETIGMAAPPQAAMTMPPIAAVPKTREGMPPSTAHASAQSPADARPASSGPDSRRRWNVRETEDELAHVRVTDIDPRDGLPSAAYLRAIDQLTTSLQTHGAAVLEPSQEERSFLQCALQASRLFFKKANDGSVQDRSSGVRKPSGAPTSSCSSCSSNLQESFTFCAKDFDPEKSYDLATPPLADKAFQLLGRLGRVALAAVGRSLSIPPESIICLVDSCPLMLGEDSTSCLSVSATHSQSRHGEVKKSALENQVADATCEAVKTEDGEITQVQASDPKTTEQAPAHDQAPQGLLCVIAADCPGLEVKDRQGNWVQVDKAVPPGSLLVLAGKRLQQLTNGACPASAFRAMGASAPPPVKATKLRPPSSGMCSHSIERCALEFLLNAKDGHDGSLSTSQAGHCSGQEAIKLSSHALEGPTSQSQADIQIPSSLASILKDPISGRLVDDAVVAPCGHTFGKHGLMRVKETLLCLHCKEPLRATDLVPNLIVRALVAAVRRERGNKQSLGLSGKSSGGVARVKKAHQLKCVVSLPAAPESRAGERPEIPLPLDAKEKEGLQEAHLPQGSESRGHGDLAFDEAEDVAGESGKEGAEEKLLTSPPDWALAEGFQDARGYEEEDEEENMPLGGEDLLGARSGEDAVFRLCGDAGDSRSSGAAQGAAGTAAGGLKAAKRKKEKENSGPGGAGLGEASGSGPPRLHFKKMLGTAKAKPGRAMGVESPFSPERDRERDRGEGGASRLKGVQFPFSVNERVLIKGNKRTPEKFVGREAIITSQCLNGWYLVRTLDTGDSVRLQYRSLQRSGSRGDGGQGPQGDGPSTIDMMQLSLLPPPQGADHLGSDQPTASPPFCTGQQLATRALSPMAVPLRSTLDGEHAGHTPGDGSLDQPPHMQASGADSDGARGRVWLRPHGESCWAEEAGSGGSGHHEHQGPGAEAASALALTMFMGPQQGVPPEGVVAGSHYLPAQWPGLPPHFPGRAGGSLVELSLAVAAVSEGYGKEEGQGVGPTDTGPGNQFVADGSSLLAGGRKRTKLSHGYGDQRGLLSLTLDPIEEAADGLAEAAGRQRVEQHMGSVVEGFKPWTSPSQRVLSEEDASRFGGYGMHHQQTFSNLLDGGSGMLLSESASAGGHESPEGPLNQGSLGQASAALMLGLQDAHAQPSLSGHAQWSEKPLGEHKLKPRLKVQKPAKKGSSDAVNGSSQTLSFKLKLPGKLVKMKHGLPSTSKSGGGTGESGGGTNERGGGTGETGGGTGTGGLQRDQAATQTQPEDGLAATTGQDHALAERGAVETTSPEERQPSADDQGQSLPLSSEGAAASQASSFTMMPLKKRDLLLGKTASNSGFRGLPQEPCQEPSRDQCEQGSVTGGAIGKMPGPQRESLSSGGLSFPDKDIHCQEEGEFQESTDHDEASEPPRASTASMRGDEGEAGGTGPRGPYNDSFVTHNHWEQKYGAPIGQSLAPPGLPPREPHLSTAGVMDSG